MTPQEKAIHRVEVHLSQIPIATFYPECKKVHKEHEGARYDQAKNHAIDEADEIMKLPHMIKNKCGYDQLNESHLEFWEREILEIRKL